MKRYTAYQPQVFPSMYVMERYVTSDVGVVLTKAEVSKAGLNRLMLFGRQGKFYATIPLKNASSFDQCDQVQFQDYPGWTEKFKKTVQSLYGRCQGYEQHGQELFEFLDKAVDVPDLTLAEFGLLSLQWMMGLFGKRYAVQTDVMFGDREQDPNDWLLKFGRVLAASEYYGGATGINGYMNTSKFDQEGIRVTAQNWKMMPYGSMFGHNEDCRVSVLDPLMVGGLPLVKILLGVQ